MTDLPSAHSLPAVLVGGPPHSGKSVLIYSLSQALRDRGVEHYALRACPDGEGDWSNEAPPELVSEIRIKSLWTPLWVERISRDIQRRQLPLLVDVGGRPTPEQAAMFGLCTHAVLLTPDAEARAWWQSLVSRHRLALAADLASTLDGENRLDAAQPVVLGELTDLERGSVAQGPAFDALVDWLAALFSAGDVDYRARHLASAPADIELLIDLDRLARTLGWTTAGAKMHWLPEHVPALLDYLPAAAPLAIYGRGTAWIQSALARLAVPADYYSFDVRLGWVQARRLPLGQPPPDGPLRFKVTERSDAVIVEGALPDQYIDLSEIDHVVAPPTPPGQGVMLTGKLPYWLYTSLASTYRAAPWLAVYQPALGGYVVVHSDHSRYPLGGIVTG